MKMNDIKKHDSLISSRIKREVKGNVPTVVKHGSWKDGGLSIPSLMEKNYTWKDKSLIPL